MRSRYAGSATASKKPVAAAAPTSPPPAPVWLGQPPPGGGGAIPKAPPLGLLPRGLRRRSAPASGDARPRAARPVPGSAQSRARLARRNHHHRGAGQGRTRAATTTFLADNGQVSVFAVVDHYNAERLGIHAARPRDRSEALELLRQAVRRSSGSSSRVSPPG